MKTSVSFLLFLFTLNFAFAQVRVLEKSSSKLSVKGTSTLHDWESDVEEFECQAQFDGIAFRDISFSAQVISIKSDKSGMDKNTYVALKQSSFPNISLSSSLLEVEGTLITGNADLTIAGVTKRIDVQLKMDQKEKIRVYGEIPLRMTSFKIDPPEAVFGTIKTGDDIVIVLDFNLK